MVKTKYEKELEKESQGPLVRMCEGKGLDHTGGKDALIARLVAFEEAKATEPEPETPETAGVSAERVAEEEAPEVKVEVTPPPGSED